MIAASATPTALATVAAVEPNDTTQTDSADLSGNGTWRYLRVECEPGAYVLQIDKW